MNRLVSLDKKEKNKISNLPSCYFNCCYQSKTSFVFVLFFVKKKKKPTLTVKTAQLTVMT